MSDKVMTVTGSIIKEDIGKCLVHQHAIFGYPGWQCSTTNFDYSEAMSYVSGVVSDAKRRFDLKTFIDATPGDCGRNVEFLKELSERTEVNIIASTGCYFEGEGASQYYKMRLMVGNAEEEIYDMMMKDLTKGVGDTDIRAGVIKVATSAEEITQYENMFLKAAGKVSAETGTRIITHTQEGKQGEEQVHALSEYGADVNKIMVGHLDGCTDIDVLLNIFETGAYGAFDRLGLDNMAGTPLENRRVALIAGLAMSGFGEKIMLSHDSIAWNLGSPWNYTDEVAYNVRNWNWTHVFDNIIPRLKSMGVKSTVVDRMVRENVHEFLCGK